MNKKHLQLKKFGPLKTAYDCLKEELKVLERLEHPNIIWLHEIIDDPNKDHIYLVTEYHSRGSLGNNIRLLNSKNKQHNDLCIAEGRGEEMKTMGMMVDQVRLIVIDLIKALHYRLI